MSARPPRDAEADDEAPQDAEVTDAAGRFRDQLKDRATDRCARGDIVQYICTVLSWSLREFRGGRLSGGWQLFGEGVSPLTNISAARAATPRSESDQQILEPDLVICDPHHHLWDLPDNGVSEFLLRMHMKRHRYLLPELLADLACGHNVMSTVFVDARAFYRVSGPVELHPVGETEFVNGIAAMSASGRYGPARVCAGFVCRADLTLGGRVEEVLLAHLHAAGSRFKGIRHGAAFDPSDQIPRNSSGPPPHLYLQPAFREGFAVLRRFGLSFDAWLYHPQLSELIDLARSFPEQPIVLDHMGTPLGLGPYAGKRAQVLESWRASIRALATCPNVYVKLGGLGMALCGFNFEHSASPVPYESVAAAWKPYIETSIDAFGTDRCMFESNFPVDEASTSYRTLWNAFKHIAAGCSASEKRQLFREVAESVYRINT
jgi:L-fuconolactonase